MNHNTRCLLPALPPSPTPQSACERGGFSEFESISIDFGENGGRAKENEGEGGKQEEKERVMRPPSLPPSLPRSALNESGV